MGVPITTTGGGICFAFPNVCMTPAGTSSVPVPYPSIGQLSDAMDVTTSVKVTGKPVILKKSSIPKTSGDESGKNGPGPGGKVEFTSYSKSVKMNGEFVVRMTDKTKQNNGNAVGVVLGGEPTVLCG